MNERKLEGERGKVRANECLYTKEREREREGGRESVCVEGKDAHLSLPVNRIKVESALLPEQEESLSEDRFNCMLNSAA